VSSCSSARGKELLRASWHLFHLISIVLDNQRKMHILLPARRYASTGNSDRNVSVRLSRAGIVSKRRRLAA